MLLHAPGKVYLIGEYACLIGRPAILLTLKPMFSLKATPSGKTLPLPFVKQSPAGKLLKDLKRWKLEWTDPYDKPIGVGSSTAQFLLSAAFLEKKEGRRPPSPEELLKKYWELTTDEKSIRPSGVDLVVQRLGGPHRITNEPFSYEKLSDWKSVNQEAVLVLAFTGTKVKTHEHLKTLAERNFPRKFYTMLDKLSELEKEAVKAWRKGAAANLGKVLNEYQTVLSKSKIGSTEQEAAFKTVQKWPEVYGCKGSGAQGGDCAILLAQKSGLNELGAKLKALGWTLIEPQWTNTGLFSENRT